MSAIATVSERTLSNGEAMLSGHDRLVVGSSEENKHLAEALQIGIKMVFGETAVTTLRKRK